jgi:hypothetical protein
VGFFDFAHGQHGAAPNVIELHPVLDIVFNPSAPGPDFTLSLPATARVAQGGSESITVTATSAAGGAAPDVTITTSGLPSGITAHVTPLGAGKATISLTASNAAPTGTFPFAVTGTANGKSHTQGASLDITAAQPPAGQQWEYQVVTATSDQDMIDKANQLGADDWEMVGIVRQGNAGWKAFFKRTKRNF